MFDVDHSYTNLQCRYVYQRRTGTVDSCSYTRTRQLSVPFFPSFFCILKLGDLPAWLAW